MICVLSQVKYLSEALVDLLFEHNCVIIPDFGGFVTEYRSARLQPGKERIYPPHKALAFNPRLNRSDGVLTHYVARRQGIAYSEAEQLVRLWSAQCKNQLEQDRILVLPAVGKLLAERGGTWRFQPDERFNYWEDAFGLVELDAKPLALQPGMPAAAQVERIESATASRLDDKEDLPILSPPTRQQDDLGDPEQVIPATAERKPASAGPDSSRRLLWLKVAAAVVLLGLGCWQLMISTGGLNALQATFQFGKQSGPVIEEGRAAFLHPLIPSLNRQMRVFGPTTTLSAVAPVAVLPMPGLAEASNLASAKSSETAPSLQTEEPWVAEVVQTPSKPDRLPASAPVETTKSSGRIDNPMPPSASMISFSGDQPAPPRGYYVILGSFPNKHSAEDRLRHIDEPVGQAAVLHAENGRYRAGLYLGTEKQGAVSRLAALRERYQQPDAWITRF